MAVEDLFELATMLKMQLPFLFSFAVMRWVLGHVVGGIGGAVLRKIGACRYIPTVVFVLHQVRVWLYLTALLGMSFAWAQEGASSGLPRICGTHTSARVQGLACTVGMVVLVTNGNALALGLALATLKSVADMSSCSVMLSSIAVLFAVRKGQGVGKLIALASTILIILVAGCWNEDGEQTATEGSILALAMLWLFVCARAILGIAWVTFKYSVSMVRRLWRIPRQLVRRVLKGKTVN
jgi:hypothetical protein